MSNAIAQDDPQRVAMSLAKHSAWAGLAFAAIILVAVALESFGGILLRFDLIPEGGVLHWAIRVGEYSLVGIDIALLIGIVGKLSWRLWKAL